MGFLTYIFGDNTSGSKIYRTTIEAMPGNLFVRQASFTIDGNKIAMSGVELRDHLARLCDNGITLSKLEQKLKQQGLKDSQYERRQEIIEIIRNNLK